MRIVAELPHQDFKITIFSMNRKFIIKFEQGNLEQTFKISELDLTDGVNSVFELLDEEFFTATTERFNLMRTDFKNAYHRYNF
jgi:hypothetical protein